MQANYCASRLRRLSPFTLFIVLQSLGLQAVICEDPLALATVRNRLARKNTAQARMRAWATHKIYRFERTTDFLRKIAADGGRARAQKLTATQRRKSARQGRPRALAPQDLAGAQHDGIRARVFRLLPKEPLTSPASSS